MSAEAAVDYLFIGGGLANATAAQKVRESDPSGRILLVSQEMFPPYHRPPLSKDYLRGEAGWQDARIARETEWAEKKIEVRTGIAATRIDTAAHTVTLDTGEVLTYRKLCLATGATPRRLDIPGADAPNVHLLRTWDDASTIRPHLVPGARAVLIGAGYIGMEVAASCRRKDVAVTVVNRERYPWSGFTSEPFGRFLQGYYEEQGVTFKVCAGAQAIRTGDGGQATAVRTTSGETLPADFVVIGVGVTLNTALAREAGLVVDDRDGVEVNEYLETSAPDVFAAGDIARFRDNVLGKNWHIEHWQNAEWHGQIAGANMTGQRVAYDHVPWFFSDIFDLHMTLRGDPQAGKTSFMQGNPDTDERFLELYLRDDGSLAMGLLISPEEDESETADLLEKLIRARVNLLPHQADIIAGKTDLATLLPAT